MPSNHGSVSRRSLLKASASVGALAAPAVGGIVAPSLLRTGMAAQSAPGTMVASISGDIDTLDPHVSQLRLFGNIIRNNVFSALIQYGPSLEYVPDLAESWEAPDATTYTFTLRQGATYHDGQEVEASHVEFSYNRIAEKGAVFASRVANIASYEVVDKYTIRMTLTAPQADFIDGLVSLSIVSPETADSLETSPIGSGPFRFVEWATNDHIALARNPDYWEPDTPLLDSLEFRVIPEPQVAITNLQAGSIDAVVELPLATATTLQDSEDFTVYIRPTSGIQMFELMGNNSEVLRTNIQVRQALAHCLDKALVQEIVLGGEGFPKWSWIPQDHWAYKELEGYPYDPETARTLLEEAGYGDGFEFTVITPSSYPEGERTATIWQAGLEEAGVTLNIQTDEPAVWGSMYRPRDFEASWNVWPGFADPNYFVAFGLRSYLEGGQWENPEALEIAIAANETVDQEERTALYSQLQDIFIAEIPVIIVSEVPIASLQLPTVTGWEVNPVGNVNWRAVSTA